MALKETTVAVWGRVEAELAFSSELYRENAHARRAPYRVIPSIHSESIGVDPVAFDAILRVHPDGLEVGTVRGEYAKSVGWSKFSAYFMWSVGVVFFVLLLIALVEVEIPITVDLLFTLAFFGFPSYFLFCFGTYFWRLATKNSLDDPVLFNKKNKVGLYSSVSKWRLF